VRSITSCITRAKADRDAGIALVACIDCGFRRASGGLASLDKMLSPDNHQVLNVIELGTGCGLVGLALASIVPKSHVVMTDTSEVIELVNVWNILELDFATSSKVAFEILNWDEPLRSSISSINFELILLADCIYNADSTPALVRTISALAGKSPNALIVNAAKTRHSSEAIFFKLMAEACFVTLDRTHVVAPMGYGSTVTTDVEHIDICVFKHRTHDSVVPAV